MGSHGHSSPGLGLLMLSQLIIRLLIVHVVVVPPLQTSAESISTHAEEVRHVCTNHYNFSALCGHVITSRPIHCTCSDSCTHVGPPLISTTVLLHLYMACTPFRLMTMHTQSHPRVGIYSRAGSRQNIPTYALDMQATHTVYCNYAQHHWMLYIQLP